MQLKGKTILLTGATSGIGEALAKELAKKGNTLILISRNKEKLENLQKSLPSEVHFFPFDLEKYHKLPSLVKKILNKIPILDALILNAGVSQRAFAEETTIQTTERIFAIDFFSYIYLTQLLLPYIREGGNITVISSVAGKIGTPFRSSYAAAKHALHGYYDSLRVELRIKKRDIGVTMICPGFVKTNVSVNALKGDGTPYKEKDPAIEKGLSPEKVAKKIIKAIERKREEIVISGAKEKIALFLKIFFPSLLNRLLEKVAVR